MFKRFKSLFKSNKKVIIISVITSALTFAVLTAGVGALLVVRSGSIDKAISNLISNHSSVVTQVDSSAEQSNVISVVEKANPAVVSIIITKDVPTYEQYYQQYNPFSGLFGDVNVPSQKQNGTQQQEIGGGSGFFVSSDGYIVTNNHVVEDTTADYTVLTNDGTKYTAKVLAKDSVMDIAILKVEGTDFRYLTFADSDKLKLGQTTIAIGNALAEFQNSISTGVISGLSRSITASGAAGGSEQLEGIIQTDAAINPGNSGGPLLDINGNVIGVNVAVEQSAQSIGFALPSNMVTEIAQSVMKNGEIVRPYMGVRYQPITASLKTTNKLSVDYGILVSRGSNDELAVIPGSPADKAGIVENDIILEVDGVQINNDKSFASIIRQKQVDQTVTLKVLHDGSEKTVQVKLEKAPKDL